MTKIFHEHYTNKKSLTDATIIASQFIPTIEGTQGKVKMVQFNRLGQLF